MAGDTVTTIVGNLAADPELRFTPSGQAVANFTVASTPRTFDRQANEWKDGETLWMRCSIWRDAAEHVAESLHKGDRVIVQGRLKMRSYEQDGQKRTVVEMEADEIGPSLRSASVTVAKVQRQGAAGGTGSPNPWSSGGQGTNVAQAAGQPQDPWAQQAAQGRAQTSPTQEPPPWGGGQQQYAEPPF